jgi:hypothetical protein
MLNVKKNPDLPKGLDVLPEKGVEDHPVDPKKDNLISNIEAA